MNKIIISMSLFIVLIGCDMGMNKQGNDDVTLLGALILNQNRTSCNDRELTLQNGKIGLDFPVAGCSESKMQSMGWTKVSLGGPSGFYSNRSRMGFGSANSFHGIENVLRDTMFEVSYSIQKEGGFIQLAGNTDSNLRNHTRNFSHIRLDLSGIQGIFWDNWEAEEAKGNHTIFAVKRDQINTVCIEFHREDHNGDLDMHMIAWNKPCSRLNDFDKTNYDWDQEYHLIHEDDFDLMDSDELAEWQEELGKFAQGSGIGFVSQNARVIRIMPIIE